MTPSLLAMIRTFWPMVVLLLGWNLAMFGWRIIMWRKMLSILDSGQRIERILLNHRHDAETGEVQVDAAGMSGTWHNDVKLVPPPGIKA